MTSIKASLLIIDFNLYPRVEVDSQHVSYMREAMRAGVVFPPIVAIKKDHRIIDGVHRAKAYMAEYGPEHPVEVILKEYRTEGDAFADAVRMNANHGRTLTRYDRVHSILRAETLGIPEGAIAAALGLTLKTVGTLRAERVGHIHPPFGYSKNTPLKQTIAHMAGKRLTKDQVLANKKLSGMNQVFYVNQIITLIESNLLDTSNDELLKRLGVLSRLIAKYGRKAA